MVLFRGRRIYIFAAAVLAAVGAVHRSRVVRWAGAVGVREGVFPADRMIVGWGPISLLWYVVVFNRRISV